MLVMLLSLGFLSVHGQNTDHQYEAMRKQVQALTETMEMLEAENAALKSDIQNIHQSKLIEPLICFSAVKNTTQSVSTGDYILFEDVLIDTDDSYFPALGVYLIPEDGLYEVIITLFKHTSSTYNSVAGALYLDDGTYLTAVYNYFSSDTSAAAHSTSSIIREFQAGDRLHVESVTSGSFYGSTSYRASQFSAKYVGEVPSA